MSQGIPGIPFDVIMWIQRMRIDPSPFSMFRFGGLFGLKGEIVRDQWKVFNLKMLLACQMRTFFHRLKSDQERVKTLHLSICLDGVFSWNKTREREREGGGERNLALFVEATTVQLNFRVNGQRRICFKRLRF